MNTDSMLMIKAVGILMLVSLAFVIKDELVIQKVEDSFPKEKKPFFSTKEDCVRFMSFTILSFLYIVALPYAGFIISTLIFPAAAMFFLGVRRVRSLVITPILLTVSTYILFKVFLMVSLPVGLFGI